MVFLRLDYLKKVDNNLPTISASLIQGNITGKQKMDSSNFELSIDTYNKLTELSLVDNTVDVIIWPESVFPFAYHGDRNFFNENLTIDEPYLVMGIVYSAGGEMTNSCLLIKDKNSLQRYDKERLLVFGEYVPFEKLFPFLRMLTPFKRSLNRGQTLSVFFMGEARASLSICFEDLFPDLIRRKNNEGSNLMINITNDSWFGNGIGPIHHSVLARLRAIENRRSFYRCTATGLTTASSITGEVKKSLKIGTEGFLKETLSLYDKRTIYSYIGELFSYITILIVLIMIIYSLRRYFLKEREKEKKMEKLLVISFGGQSAHLIAKKFRSLGFYAELASPNITKEQMDSVKGIVLSSSPASVSDNTIINCNRELFSLGIPVLGISYGFDLINHYFDGKIETEKKRKGSSKFKLTTNTPLFNGITEAEVVITGKDRFISPPEGFEVTAITDDKEIIAIQNLEKKIFAVKFHPELDNGENGDKIFLNFANIAGMQKNWDMNKFVSRIEDEIRDVVKDKSVLLFLSGGVDSTVTFALLNKVLGKDRVLGLHIDNGFMRLDESAAIKSRYHEYGLDNFVVYDGSKHFLDAVRGVIDPQEKRNRVGLAYITFREEVLNDMKLDTTHWLLGQGTIYPDIIESGNPKHANTIKTHHNRIDLITEMIEKGLVVEPIKDLYKDEVRKLGSQLGFSELMKRHPFPGPGLSINVLGSTGELSEKDEELYKEATKKLKKIKLSEFIKDRKSSLSVIPVKSTGVTGEARTYKFPAALSIDNIMEDFVSFDILDKISKHITEKVGFVNRVVLELYARKDDRNKKLNLSLQPAHCNKERLDMIREVDDIFIKTLKKHGYYDKIFQNLTINIPYAESPDKCSIVLRPVVSIDAMSAEFAKIPVNILLEVVDGVKRLDFVDALFFDLTNKPPATIAWE